MKSSITLTTLSVVLGAFFMATDYATTPLNKSGKIIFGIGCGETSLAQSQLTVCRAKSLSGRISTAAMNRRAKLQRSQDCGKRAKPSDKRSIDLHLRETAKDF